MRVEHSPSVHGGGVQGYTPRKNQSSHGVWDSVDGPVSPRRDILRDWTRTFDIAGELKVLCCYVGSPISGA